MPTENPTDDSSFLSISVISHQTHLLPPKLLKKKGGGGYVKYRGEGRYEGANNRGTALSMDKQNVFWLCLKKKMKAYEVKVETVEVLCSL